MVEYQYDDGGRADAGFKGHTGDCGVRACAIALDMPYKEVYDALQRIQNDFVRGSKGKIPDRKRPVRSGVFREVMTEYLSQHGFKWRATQRVGEAPHRVQDIVDRHPTGAVIMRLHGHFSTIVDGINRDTWQQVPMKAVYGVWVKVD